MENILDARGHSCPEPLLMTKKALTTSNIVKVLVDNECALENITRFARNNGFKANATKNSQDYLIEVVKNA